jgi:acylphosphatase
VREKAVHVLISGHVQQVGYRQACRTRARSLGLVGWVRNLNSGQVEAFAQGEDVRIDELIEWAWTGPSAALVTGVESDNVATDATLTDFFIQPNPESL